MLRKQLELVYNGGRSKRYHTVDTHTIQNIAEHSFGVAWLCELLTEGKARKELIMSALVHDLAEYQVGDVPSPTKRALGLSGELGLYERKFLQSANLDYEENLTADETRILKIADNLDGMSFCVREHGFGNKTIDIVFFRFQSYVAPLLTTAREHEVFNNINNEWERYSER